MIRIRRGAEPGELKAARRRALARAILTWCEGKAQQDPTADKELDFSGYKVAKRDLFEAQHWKCAYCEGTPRSLNQPVEHFRPKAGAWRGDPRISRRAESVDPDHYWWLAWSWDNLFFACGTCNGKASKGNWFPLKQGSPALALPPKQALADLPMAHRDFSCEEPMLIDPVVDDPMGFLRWAPENPESDWDKLRWKPFGTDAGGRGATTISTLMLDRELPDHVSGHVRTHLKPKVERLCNARALGDKASADRTWDELVVLFEPAQLYLAATYDALEWFLDHPRTEGVREFVGRSIPRPGASGTDPVSEDILDSPAIQGLPEELRLRVRADLWTSREAVLALCAAGSFSAPVLASELARAETSITAVCRALERDGLLQRKIDASGATVFEAVEPKMR